MSDLVLLGAIDLARRLGVSVRTVRRLDAAGKLPKPVRLGHSVRWRSDEIERWVVAGCPERATWQTQQ